MTASWLLLERYALGECDPAEVARIQTLLVDDSDARAILVAIQGDRRAVPPLPRSSRRRWPLAVLLLAAVALVVVGLRARGPDGNVKGGELALELVRLQDGLATPVSDVRVGDRLGLRLTCPPGRARVDVVVFHDGEAAFPVDSATVTCGNGVAIPGAFSVDRPGPLVACVTVGPPREILAAGPPLANVCVEADVHW